MMGKKSGIVVCQFITKIGCQNNSSCSLNANNYFDKDMSSAFRFAMTNAWSEFCPPRPNNNNSLCGLLSFLSFLVRHKTQHFVNISQLSCSFLVRNSEMCNFTLADTASTACGHRMANRKWKETKQLPGNMLGNCLVSFHFLWAILCPQAVVFA